MVDIVKAKPDKKEFRLLSMAVYVVLAAACVGCLALPMVQYKYEKYYYTLNGFRMLTGATISGGSVHVSSQLWTWLVIVGALTILAAAVLSRKAKVKVFQLTAGAGALVVLAGAMVFIINYTTALKGAKKLTLVFGIYVIALLAVLALAYAVTMLYRNRTILMLDFMLVPGLLYLILNNYMPMSGLILAFKNINYSTGIFQSPWCGLENFEYLFSSGSAWLITRNTVLYNLLFIVVGNVLGLAVGICLSECFNKYLMRTSQTLILLPQLLSAVIVSYIVYGFLSGESGWINHTLNLNIAWYRESKYWPVILLITSTWMGLGYRSIIYLSSIVGVDRSLYEAACIDGCSKWKQITKITIPMIRPTIIMLVLMSISRIMGSDFGLFYQVPMNSGFLYNVTQTIDTYVYRALMKESNYSLSLAANAYQAVVGFILIITTNALTRKIDKDSALF